MSQSGIPPMIPRNALLRGSWIAKLVAVALLMAFFVGFVEWFIIRVEVNAGQILVLVNKTGQRLPDDLAPEFDDQVVLYPSFGLALNAVPMPTSWMLS